MGITVDLNDFTFDRAKMLGEGSFGAVYEGIETKSNKKVAIKEIVKIASFKQLGNEIAIMKKISELDHENFVKLFAYKELNSHTYLIMELCDLNLKTYLREKEIETKEPISEMTIKIFLRQIGNAVEILHDRKIIHRDLKPDNILLTSRTSQSNPLDTLPRDFIIKIADFGFARLLEYGHMASTTCGTPIYQAPEINRTNDGRTCYDNKVDMWSIGIMCLHCFIGAIKFSKIIQNLSEEQVKLRKVNQTRMLSSYWKDIIKNLTPTNVVFYDLINQLVEPDPHLRIDIKKFVQHSFFDLLSRGSLLEIKQAIKEGRMPIRGTNLGGWLVTERWMTGGSPAWNGVPDNVANQGECVTMKYLGHANGDAQFNSHRSTFITEQDFKDIAAAELNTVRIPVGYWITGFDNSGGGDPDGWKVYAPGAINYLDKAIREWAPRNNLLVLISLHAAKGSQNGAGHSAPQNPDQAYWSSYPENVNNTLDAIEWLARRYNNDVSFLGIGLLNAPRCDINENVLKQYYYDAYGRIRAIPSDCLLTTSPLLSESKASGNWNSFMLPPGWHGIRQEWQRYQVWGFEGSGGWTAQKLIDYTNNQLANDVKDWNGNWLSIEWSIATAVDISDDNTLRSYAQSQLEAFSKAKGGWTYWTWKFYNDDGSSRNQWSMKSMIKMGLL